MQLRAYRIYLDHKRANIEHFNQVVERRKRGGEPEEMDATSDESVDASTL